MVRKFRTIVMKSISLPLVPLGIELRKEQLMSDQAMHCFVR